MLWATRAHSCWGSLGERHGPYLRFVSPEDKKPETFMHWFPPAFGARLSHRAFTSPSFQVVSVYDWPAFCAFTKSPPRQQREVTSCAWWAMLVSHLELPTSAALKSGGWKGWGLVHHKRLLEVTSIFVKW